MSALPVPKPRAPACEADTAEGLEAVAQEEMQDRLGSLVHLQAKAPGVVTFTYRGDVRHLLRLQTVQAVYLVQPFAVARPKALLGDEHFRKLLQIIADVRSRFDATAFQTLYLSAAGSDSTVMTRLKTELAQRTGLAVGEEEGDLLLRIRPGSDGWEVLVRLSPRPLATRAWRVCNYEGALNAAVANAMIRLLQPKPREVFLNIACGSGTLLCERLTASRGHARLLIGCDVDPQALACAHANTTACRRTAPIVLHQADGRALPLADGCVDSLATDLPFGHLVGSHAENVRTYPLFLREAARVARSGARLALITHELRLTEQLVSAQDSPWQAEQVLKVELGGLHPRVFILRRAVI